MDQMMADSPNTTVCLEPSGQTLRPDCEEIIAETTAWRDGRASALAYAQFGWRVLPLHSISDEGSCTCGNPSCESPGEHPITSLISNGVQDATTDAETITDWWQEGWSCGERNINVGVAVGAESNVMVLEVSGEAGTEALCHLEKEHEPLPPTAESCTDRGRCLWFQHPSDHIPNRTSLVPGIDVRGDGGCVMAPRSPSPSEPHCTWKNSPTKIADTPNWICEMLPAQDMTEKPKTEESTGGAVRSDKPVSKPRPSQTERGGSKVPSKSPPTGKKATAQRKFSKKASSPRKEHDGFKLPEPQPWPDPVNGAELLEGLRTAFHRHLILPAGGEVALTLWAVFTHTIDAHDVSPRLALISPTPECGKTTVLSILGQLVPRPLPTSNVSGPAVFRAIEKFEPTLLVDEADTFFGFNNELTGIVNSGHTRANAFVVRCHGDDHDVKRFSTWGAFAIASKGKKLPDALASRSITLPMQRKRPEEKVDRFPPLGTPEIHELARKCARWARDKMDELRGTDPEMPDGLHGRAADNWRPLFAIADAAGGEWPRIVREAALRLHRREDILSLGELLLADIRGVFNEGDTDELFSATLAARLRELEERPWGKYDTKTYITPANLAERLMDFGIKPERFYIGVDRKRGYKRAWFEDAWARYL